ncbi:MAG TPA: tautomerase family protein [Calditerricola sp.]
MPFIEVILENGKLPREAKRALAEGIAGVVKRVLSSKPEQIRIVLYEIPKENLFEGSAGAADDPVDER